MSESEIKAGIDRTLESLQAQVAELKSIARRFETLADNYYRELCSVKHERNHLLARLNRLEAAHNSLD